MVNETKEEKIERMQQILNFCNMAILNKTAAWKYGEEGLTKGDLRRAGIDDTVIAFLEKNHYISDRRADGILWIASTKNKFYPSQTVQNLKRKAEDFLIKSKVVIENHNSEN